MQNNLDITNIGSWVLDNDDKIYRILEYKKVFTPLEMEEKYIDQGEFASDYYEKVKIVEAIEIPNDVLLKMLLIYDDNELEENIYLYKKLSDIRLQEFDIDNRKEAD